MLEKETLSLAVAICVSLTFGSLAQAKEPEKTKTTKTTTTTLKTKTTASKFVITEDGAINLVKKLPDVKQFFANVPISGIAKPAITVDRKEGDAYVVHVFEIVNDGTDTSHTATKNWYYVNYKTGKITTEF